MSRVLFQGRDICASSSRDSKNMIRYSRIIQRENRNEDHENSLFTEVFPSWFFFKTYRGEMVQVSTCGDNRGTNLSHCELEILLGYMLSSFTKSVHPCPDLNVNVYWNQIRDVPASVHIPRTSAPEH